MEKRRQPEIIAGRVNADGSIAAGDGFTVTKTATGTYQVTFAAGFRPISMALGASQAMFAVFLPSTTAWQVTTYTTGSVLTDIAFQFIAVGVQT